MRRSLVVMVLLAGCGSEDAAEPGALALEPFAERQITLAMEEQRDVRLSLNRAAPDVAFVDVDNPRPTEIELVSDVITVLPSKQDVEVSITGRGATGGSVELKFSLRDSATDPVWLGVEVR